MRGHLNVYYVHQVDTVYMLYVVRCVRYVLKVRRTHILILNFKGVFR